MYLANPALAGGAAGGVLFGLLAVFELTGQTDAGWMCWWTRRFPPAHGSECGCRLMSGAALTLCLAMLVWLPVSRGLIGAVFDGAEYLLAYALFMGLALLLGILAASSAYQFARRADLTLVALAVLRAEPERLGGRLAALLAEPLRLGAVRRLFQLPNFRSMWPGCA